MPPSPPNPSFSHIFSQFLSIFFIFAISTTVASASSPPSSFYSILRSHGLPIGLFPKHIINFSIEPATGQFEVYLDRSCSAKFENEVHYDFNLTGTLSYGQIGELSGVSAQDLFLWFPVKNIRVDVPSSGVIYFDVGGVVSKQFSLSLFETPPDCVDSGVMTENGGDFVDISEKLASKIQSEKDKNKEGVLRAIS